MYNYDIPRHMTYDSVFTDRTNGRAFAAVLRPSLSYVALIFARFCCVAFSFSTLKL